MSQDIFDDIHKQCQTEIDNEKSMKEHNYKRCKEYKEHITELESQLQAKDAEIERMKPVVDAAIKEVKYYLMPQLSADDWRNSQRELAKAVADFQSSSPKTKEEEK